MTTTKDETVAFVSFRPELFMVDPPALTGMKCTRCGRKSFPSREVCPLCGADTDLLAVTLGRVGRVYSYTIVRQAPAGLETPYVLAYVDLPDDEVRVMSQIVGVEAESVYIGQVVELDRAECPTVGATTMMFVFRAVPEDAEVAR